jgi:hypothetical protein
MASALAIVLWSFMALECRHAPQPRVATRRLFGPVLANDVIVGRADDNAVTWVVVGERMLVRIDVVRRTVDRYPIRMGDAATCWGLARLADGSLWTLKGRRAAIQISERGEVLNEIPLPGPQFGIFAAVDRLVYQPADFRPPAPLLFTAGPGDAPLQPWSSLRSRAFALARTSVAALNMLSCGESRREERPCWFPDEAAVALITPTGSIRHIVFPGLVVVKPEVLLTADNPARAVRDAYIDSSGTIWVLSSGSPLAGAEDQPGGWILARYTESGTLIGLQHLAESVRLILRAEPGRALLLTGGGMVAEVVP